MYSNKCIFVVFVLKIGKHTSICPELIKPLFVLSIREIYGGWWKWRCNLNEICIVLIQLASSRIWVGKTCHWSCQLLLQFIAKPCRVQMGIVCWNNFFQNMCFFPKYWKIENWIGNVSIILKENYFNWLVDGLIDWWLIDWVSDWMFH